MKRRVRKIANFFAFNLLFFALYLNFIHKDKRPANMDLDQATIQQSQGPAAFGETVLVSNPDQYIHKKEATVAAQQTVAPKAEEATSALKLSIN
jgi:hypothetical protein